MKTKSTSSSKRKLLNNLSLETYTTKFTIEKTIKKYKDSNKAYRTLYIKVGGKIICKNKRRYSYSEYKQRLALLVLYSKKLIDLFSVYKDDNIDYHYLYEEAAWEYCLPEGRQKIVGISYSAFAIRPFITKWRIGFTPVCAELKDKKWTSLKFGVYNSYDGALKALASALPHISYFDSKAIEYVEENIKKAKEQLEERQRVREEISKKINPAR